MVSGEYDLVVVGGGSAGLEAADLAIKLGARVALVEMNRIGGDCTWTGCVPSKALLKAAKVAHEMRHAHRYGLTAANQSADLHSVMSHVRDVVAQIYRQESPEILRAKGIDVFPGEAHFISPRELAVADVILHGRRFLLATGAHPFIPPIEGLDSVNYLTYNSIWELDVLPQRLLVVGAGPIGCELAQAFSRLGADVTIIEAGERISDEPEVAQVISGVFMAEGIDVRPNVMVERAWSETDGIHLAAGNEQFAGDALLVAVGRWPSVDGLDLERAGVAYSAAGIQVDAHLRTSQRHIYAAGDCIGSYQFTHYAAWQAAIAVRNALLPGSAKGVTGRVPWNTFTDPEVAHVGLTEEQARQKYGHKVQTYQWPMEKSDRAWTDDNTAGFIKLVYMKGGKLLGVTIVAAQAGEMIHEWVVTLERHLKVDDLADIIHVYPTYSVTGMQASADIRITQLLRGISGRIIRWLVRRGR